MHRTDAENNVNGQFTDDFEGTLQGTVVEQAWLNAVQEEIISVLTLAGIAPVKDEHDQLVNAIMLLITAAQAARGVLVYGVETTNPGSYIEWSGEAYDSLNMHSPDGTTLTIPAGVAQVRLKCQLEIQGDWIEAEIRKNGAGFVGAPKCKHVDAVVQDLIISLESPIIAVQEGDVFQVYLSHGTLQNNSLGDFAWFALEVIP